MKEKELLNRNHCVCRECMNRQYSTKLLPKNCYYSYYRSECVICGEMHQMIQKLHFTGKLKIIFARKPKEKKLNAGVLDT